MTEAGQEPWAAMADRLTSIATNHGREVRTDPTWIGVQDPNMDLPEHGWKIHISARVATLHTTVERVLPVLLTRTCTFKVAASSEVLREINSGSTPGSVGKAITVYPSQDAVVDTARELAAALTGFVGPRVLSDCRLRADAPVYYRYGPFVARFQASESGTFEMVMTGPDGVTFPGVAGLEYRCPPWARDPFRESVTVPAAGDGRDGAEHAAVLGGHYRLASGIARAAHGNVYRAVNVGSGQQVVVKQARAYVGETIDGDDVRASLRNERRMLAALTGVAGVPQLVDHFRHESDEYLVTTSVGDRDLRKDVENHGVYAEGTSGGGRSLAGLATQLVTVLDAVHERGVVVRDLTPKNVVLDEAGNCSLVDFGISSTYEAEVGGWTPGYSLPGQLDRQPAAADDYYALGGTLLYAATGMYPVVIDRDQERNRERTLTVLAELPPEQRGGVCALIPRLLSLDAGQRSAAAGDIRAGRHLRDPHAWTVSGRKPARPAAVSTELLDAITEHTLAECLRHARDMMRQQAGEGPPPVTNVYRGAAGLGMELLQHSADPRVREVVHDLARWTARALPACPLPRGLYSGSTGVAVFLAAAGRALGETYVDLPADAGPLTARSSQPEEPDDYVHGVAGIGAGHLALAGMDSGGVNGEPDHLAVAAQCARRLLDRDVRSAAEGLAQPPAGSPVVPSSGFAHGTAGTAYFLLAYVRASGDAAAAAGARERFDALAAEAERVLPLMAGPHVPRMSASWCNGMAGVGPALLRGFDFYGEDSYLALARDAARACLAVAPRLSVVSQCCGLAGVGELLIDTATTTGEEELWHDAGRVAGLILSRSGGGTRHPLIPDDSLTTTSGGWARGSSGVLSFFRRLRDRGGPRLWMTERPL